MTLFADTGCASRLAQPSVEHESLSLSRVVLYRNGVGYFEREGEAADGVLRLRVRKDHVNDLLKSLTVVDADGRALSISMPLDPQHWAAASLAAFENGEDQLAHALNSLRGTEVAVRSDGGNYSGRIVLVEPVVNLPPSKPRYGHRSDDPANATESRDHRLVLLAAGKMQIVRLSTVRSIALKDGDLALQFHRSLDASAGEGMFQMVDVDIQLSGASKHRLLVSYVVGAPMWKPTYRVVLPGEGEREALLQSWAVVDNVSGEDWRNVKMSLTAGSPLAFTYEMHAPRYVERVDMSEAGTAKQARVAVGSTYYEQDAAAPEMAPAPAPADDEDAPAEAIEEESRSMAPAGSAMGRMGHASKSEKPRSQPAAPPPPKMAIESLRQSVSANTQAHRVSGLTQIDLKDRVSVPDGSSTMVALINQSINAQETFMFKAGGAGQGFEFNPYRVVRFVNETPYALESGPISIVSGGAFVGEGITDPVGSGASVTIPFAVEPAITVRQNTHYVAQEQHLVRLVRGVLEVVRYQRTSTTWEVTGPKQERPYTVLVEQARAGTNYTLVSPPAKDGVEVQPTMYTIPVQVKAQSTNATLEVIEETPTHLSLSLWDGNAIGILELALAGNNLDAKAREQLAPIVEARRQIGRIDTELEGLDAQQRELDARAEETRRNLEAIKKDKRANELRQKLSARLEGFTREADAMGRRKVELNAKRLELKIALEESIESIDLAFADPPRKAESKE